MTENDAVPQKIDPLKLLEFGGKLGRLHWEKWENFAWFPVFETSKFLIISKFEIFYEQFPEFFHYGKLNIASFPRKLLEIMGNYNEFPSQNLNFVLHTDIEQKAKAPIFFVPSDVFVNSLCS